MKTTTKKISDTRVELTVTLDAADLKTARAQALEQLAKNIKVQGFRKGKAPASLVEQQISANDIAGETIDLAVRQNLPAAFDAAKIAPLAVDKVNVTKYVPDQSAEFTAAADILPEVKLGDYKKLSAKLESATPKAAEVQEVIDNILNAYT